ncbi:MAG: hypothetical protein RJA77_534, partial [Pseudomonadota bacterium]
MATGITVGIVGRDKDLYGEGSAGEKKALSFVVELSAPSTQTVRVNYATIDLSATSGSDYVGVKGTLVFAPGERTKTVEVEVLGDNLDEQQEIFRFELSAPEGAALVEKGTEGMRWPFAVGYIHNDDRAKPQGYEYVVANSSADYTKFGTVDLTQAFGKPINWEIGGVTPLAVGDLNNDGYDDLFIAAYLRGDSVLGENVRSAILMFNPSTQQYEVDVTVQAVLSESRYPRRAFIGDLNGDGLNDLFVADKDEYETVGGAQNQLYLQTSTGLKNASSLLPNYVDFTHGLLIADFNKDGVNDLLVLNQLQTNRTGITNKSYLLTFSDPHTLKEASLDLSVPAQLAQTEQAARENPQSNYLSGLAADLNGDGIPEIVLSAYGSNGANSRTLILESKGVGQYGPGVWVDPPASYIARLAAEPKFDESYGSLVSVGESAALDLTGDGQDELVIALYNSDPSGRYSVNSYLQVISRDDSGRYVDITDKVVPQQYNDNGNRSAWAQQPLQRVDLDSDGDLDLIVTNKVSVSRGNPNDFWINDGGVLKPWMPFDYFSSPTFLQNQSGTWLSAQLGEKNYALLVEAAWDNSKNELSATNWIVQGISVGETLSAGSPKQVIRPEVRGTDLADRFVSLAGNTAFDGGAGTDSLHYFGVRSDYVLTTLNGSIQLALKPVSGSRLALNDGVDTLNSIERVLFYD